MEFISAGELKQRYCVFGNFYSLTVCGTNVLNCRSVLEIREAHNQTEAADAVFVMMNPGSSRPSGERNTVNCSECLSEREIDLVPTEPDTTQYQVMRLMRSLDWQFVRVINLSDIREPQSRKFEKTYREVEGLKGGMAHSVFSQGRADELDRYLSRRQGGPIVCAWGVSEKLDPLIERAKNKLSDETAIKGLAKLGHPWKFFHPQPPLQKHKREWLSHMLDQLKT